MTVAERGCQSSSSRSTAQPNGSNREGSGNLILEGGLRTVLLASLDPVSPFLSLLGFTLPTLCCRYLFFFYFFLTLWFLM